jgi:hypothetical protein
MKKVTALPLLVIFLPAAAFAQQTGVTQGGTTVGPVPGPAPAPAPAPGPTPGPTGGATAGAGRTGPIGGGNVTSSSSRPIAGPNDRDSFDLGPRAGGGGGGGGTMFGDANGPIFQTGGAQTTGDTYANVHVVRKGDTLWDICDAYFRNPYQWPRIWSYNPQIQNPHWIYPGDQVRLRSGASGASLAVPTTPEPQTTGTGSITDRRRQVPAGTIFLRNEGFIEDEKEINWGEITGSHEDKMFLSDWDEVYLKINGDRDIKIGQELTVYRPIRKAGDGKIVQIQGTVKVNNWNPKDRVARARVTETLDVIERGARIGPVTRKFEVVPPVRNDNDVSARILTSIVPHNFYGQNQVVFIDKGEADGLKPGNRLFLIRKGDAWHKSLPSSSAANRIALESESPAQVEKVPRPRSTAELPEEYDGELRVLNVKPHTAVAIVTGSRREIEPGEQVFARKGF